MGLTLASGILMHDVYATPGFFGLSGHGVFAMMRNAVRIGVVFGTVAVTGTMLVARASDDSLRAGPPTFEITDSTIDCGGGTSSGGTYSLSGTIGQPDAGAMTGGTFELQGGFCHGGVINNCPADLAGNDGLVNVSDLFALLANWNTAGPGADLAPPNNIVNTGDLFTLLAAWGACN